MAKAAKKKVAEVMDEEEIEDLPKKSAKKQKSMEETAGYFPCARRQYRARYNGSLA